MRLQRETIQKQTTEECPALHSFNFNLHYCAERTMQLLTSAATAIASTDHWTTS
nr:MAG TPA: hypothetical protein [Caudoviricetes sp.]